MVQPFQFEILHGASSIHHVVRAFMIWITKTCAPLVRNGHIKTLHVLMH